MQKWGVKIHDCTLLLDFLALFWLYCTHALAFLKKPWLCCTCENNFNSTHLKLVLNCTWFCLLCGIIIYNRLLFFVNNISSSLLIYDEIILFPVGIDLFKLNNKNTRKRCEICLKLPKKDTRMITIDMNTQ